MRHLLSTAPRCCCIFLLGLATAIVSAPSRAEDAPAAETEPLWKSSIGLSFLATSGNTDTSSLGLKLDADRRQTPWGLGIKLSADRAEENSQLTAERYYAGFRATRALASKPEIFAGVSFEHDEFAGIDLRTLLELGVVLSARETEQDSLHFDIGLTWTDEERVAPDLDVSGFGAILGLRYKRQINEHTAFSQTLTAFPSFEDSDDWRLESLSALTAALSERFAVQLGYEVRYRNQPIGDRDDTDTSAKASLVLSL